MKITGAVSLAAPPEQVWQAIHDPAVLARTLPGCESLVEKGDHAYGMRVTMGVAAVRGTYDGTIHLEDLEAPTRLRLTASGAGAPGTVEADVDVRVDGSDDGGTRVTYDADAQVGGPIGGVGQRMLSGVTKRMAGQFFAALDAEIHGVPPELRAVAPLPVAAGAPAAPSAPPLTPGAPSPAMYAGRAAQAEPFRGREFALGVATGGAIALVGVVVGWAIGRR
ncbi:carbon monoxide dehydrogenase subunit G [Terrabacter sp. BE26]|uniref:SRPBCC family protein n=1 Tax=Terrabacter sp. BE26 TaxID=2898152 RepID=UPI0035BE994B